MEYFLIMFGALKLTCVRLERQDTELEIQELTILCLNFYMK